MNTLTYDLIKLFVSFSSLYALTSDSKISPHLSHTKTWSGTITGSAPWPMIVPGISFNTAALLNKILPHLWHLTNG